MPAARWARVLPLGAALLAAPIPGDATLSTEIGSASIPAGVSAGTRVPCPAGTVSVGGGVDADVLALVARSFPVHADGTLDGGRLLEQPDGSGPGPLGWQAGMWNPGPAPGTVKAAAICSDAGSTRTEVASGVVDASAAAGMVAHCPPGRAAIGGGVDVEQPASMTVAGDGPLMEFEEFEDPAPFYFKPDGIHPAPVGWFSVAKNDDAEGRSFKVGAICSVRFPAQTVIDSVIVPSGGQESLRVACPGGLRASSGGAALQNSLQMLLNENGPYFRLRSGAEADLGAMEDGLAAGPAGWTATAANIGFGPLTMKVAAICVPEPGVAAQPLAAAGVLALLARRRRCA